MNDWPINQPPRVYAPGKGQSVLGLIVPVAAETTSLSRSHYEFLLGERVQWMIEQDPRAARRVETILGIPFDPRQEGAGHALIESLTSQFNLLGLPWTWPQKIVPSDDPELIRLLRETTIVEWANVVQPSDMD